MILKYLDSILKFSGKKYLLAFHLVVEMDPDPDRLVLEADLDQNPRQNDADPTGSTTLVQTCVTDP
jgi:hypothetical protein